MLNKNALPPSDDFIITHLVLTPFLPVSALKPEEMPEVRVETEERQNAGYEVYHQKLV